ASSRAVSYRHATFLQQEKWRRRLHLKAGGSAAFLQTAGLRAAARGRCGSKCNSEITAQSPHTAIRRKNAFHLDGLASPWLAEQPLAGRFAVTSRIAHARRRAL